MTASKTAATSPTMIDPYASTVDQLLALLKRRKILWEFHLGTILQVNGPALQVLLDGDDTPISARCFTGFLASQRVALIFVPPSGYYVVGLIGDAQGVPEILMTATRGASTTGLTTSGTTELNLSFLQTEFSASDGYTYEFFTHFVSCVQTVATDQFQLRFKRDVSITGTELGLFNFSNGNTGSMSLNASSFLEASQTESISLFVSVARTSGTGTLSVFPRVAGGGGQLSSYTKVMRQGFTGIQWIPQ